MIEREFSLITSPEIKRYYLHNNYVNEKHVVTMQDVENAFQHDPTELIRIMNNNSAVWFLEEIYENI